MTPISNDIPQSDRTVQVIQSSYLVFMLPSIGGMGCRE